MLVSSIVMERLLNGVGRQGTVRRQRILVVDDDRGLRQLYRAALMLAGFQVETAEDGLSALRRIDQGRPDLVVLDLHMPCIDGLAVLSELRANSDTVSVPVVVVTGTEYGFTPGDEVSTVLKKPCEPEELLSVIEHYLRSAA